MINAFCLAVMCLLFMAAVLALKPTMSSRAVWDAAALHSIASVATISDSSSAFPVANTSSKVDTPPNAHSVDAVEKVAVEATKIAPVRVDAQSAPTKPEVVSWHWHAGSKVTKQTAVRDR
jgi:hypothetical protein